MPSSPPAAPAAVRDLACNPTRQIFPRRYRLLRRGGFSRILQCRPQVTDWFAIHWVENQAGHARLGITIGKRVVPSAVARNRLKRLIREQFRMITGKSVSRDVVVRLRKQPGKAERREVGAILAAALRRILAVQT